jgi:hypothetical protein
VVDFKLWFWHTSFGFPDTLNDVKMWETFTLFESMLNGEHDFIDHDFVVNGQVFTKKLLGFRNIYSPHKFLLEPSLAPKQLEVNFVLEQ